MLNAIENAFSELDAKLIASDQKWAADKIDTRADVVEKARAAYTGPKRDFNCWMVMERHFGSAAMMNMLYQRGRNASLELMEKNTRSKIAKRNAQIFKALIKKGITEIAPFELNEVSDGFEGYFLVGDLRVSIRTVLAGGYNIQRLHMRTLVKVV